MRSQWVRVLCVALPTIIRAQGESASAWERTLPKQELQHLTYGATPGELDDYRWLVGSEAAGLMRDVAESPQAELAMSKSLRKALSAARTRILLEQVELRRRARKKFSLADRLFFERVALEQATDEWIASYKQSRFGPERIADLCCGLGGDTMALAQGRPVVGFERDGVKCLLATANLEVADPQGSSTVVESDVEQARVEEFAAWHIDPDRRGDGRRSTTLVHHQPSAEFLTALLGRQPNGGIKLAPATDVDPQWEREAELEWISRQGECRQLVCWFGNMSRHAGQRAATIVAADGSWQQTIVGCANRPAPVAALASYLYEPDAAVLAAKLVGELAAKHSLGAIAPGSVYLTSDVLVADRALAAFAVEEVMPLDRKRLRSALRARGIGRLEIKKRGIDLDPERLRRELALQGDASATLIVTSLAGRGMAILATRPNVDSPAGAASGDLE